MFPPPQQGLLQQPYQYTGNTVNNPFALTSIMEESTMPSLDPQQQQGITYLPVQVTQYAVVGTNPFEQQQQQQQQQQGQAQRNSNLIDM